MSVNALSGKIVQKQSRYPVNRTSASADSHMQPEDEHKAYSGYLVHLITGGEIREEEVWVHYAFLVDFLCGVFTWSRFIDKMSPRKVYSFYCLLFSLTGAITIIRSVQQHFLVTQIPSVSQMLLAIALQWLLLREWVKMSCFLSLLFLHLSILSQKEHTLHFTQIISSLSFLGSTKMLANAPPTWYQHLPWKSTAQTHTRDRCKHQSRMQLA